LVDVPEEFPKQSIIFAEIRFVGGRFHRRSLR